MISIWDFFDEINVITIPQHTSRINKMKINFKKVKLYKYTINTFETSSKITNDVKNSGKTLLSLFLHNSGDETSVNIMLNHLSIIKRAYYNNKKYIMIMENDAEFVYPLPFSNLYSTIEWLKNNKWDIFYFGYCSTNIRIKRITPVITQISSPLLAHCYALSRSGMKKILVNAYKYKHLQIDKFYSLLFPKSLGIYPIINYQSIEPAIYKRIKKQLKLNIPFNCINKGLEICAHGLYWIVIAIKVITITSIIVKLIILIKDQDVSYNN